MLKEQVFSIKSRQEFDSIALEIFRHQALNCPVYRQFIEGLKIDPFSIYDIAKIPFLPVECFKNHTIISSPDAPVVTFTSSGTTGATTSRHAVTDVSWYRESFRRTFKIFYGDITSYCILALLPSYLERGGSSLIYMAQDLIGQSNHPDSGFFLYDHDNLYSTLKKQQELNQPTILIGVTFALIDFADQFPIDFPKLIVMETGGMKGRRKEMIRDELHTALCKGFGVKCIHAEYGMTELLSQAYSKGNGVFNCPPWMKVIARDINDPFTYLGSENTGGINVIDLANFNSCSFIATQDLGRVSANESFKVLGRFDNSDIRGCNLLVG